MKRQEEKTPRLFSNHKSPKYFLLLLHPISYRSVVSCSRLFLSVLFWRCVPRRNKAHDTIGLSDLKEAGNTKVSQAHDAIPPNHDIA